MDPAGSGPFAWACPICRAELEFFASGKCRCRVHGHSFQQSEGIWRFLAPERLESFAQFIAEYERVRREEGRFSDGAAFYRQLPYRDLTGRRMEEWRLRALSFNTLLRQVIEPAERNSSYGLRILDQGAGNGWLSNRLAGRGHDVAAVDLLVNDFDGLLAYRHFENAFCPAQAEFDALPFAEGAFDMVIFNASLHYSTNFDRTLAESRRVLGDGGSLVVADTPVYRNGSSGQQMVREREAEFSSRFGFPSNSVASENYLTYGRARELARNLGLRWRWYWPTPRWRWVLRRGRSRWRGQREPAQFPLLVGH